MVRKRRVGFSRVILTILVVIMSLGVSVYADDEVVEATQNVKDYLSSITRKDGQTNLPNKFKPNGTDTISVTFNYINEAGDEVSKTIDVKKTSLDSMDKSGASTQVQKKVDDMVGGMAIEADTAAATDLMRGITPIISLIIGVLAYAIVIFLPVWSAVDIVYITWPIFREKADSAKASGSNGVMTRTNNKTGQTSFRFITDEAVHAVQSANLADGKSAISIYLGKRVGVYIAVAIVLYLLISGNIQVFTQLAIRIVSGIMTVIEQLAL